PGHAAARAVLARVWIADGRRDAARQLLREGREQGAITAFGRRLLAGLLADEGRSTEAFEVLSASGAEAIDSPDHHALYATLLQDLGRHDEAAASWRNVLQLDSHRADAWLGMGLSFEALGRKEQAHTAYRAALRVGGLEEAPAQWAASRVEALAP
ncbi:MAG: hypothetical protein HKP30_16080, partial [Myxococcales bacterium]|nr:hypothetical protein [Myxococcales bacterium]